jgi:hypothetical protein
LPATGKSIAGHENLYPQITQITQNEKKSPTAKALNDAEEVVIDRGWLLGFSPTFLTKK